MINQGYERTGTLSSTMSSIEEVISCVGEKDVAHSKNEGSTNSIQTWGHNNASICIINKGWEKKWTGTHMILVNWSPLETQFGSLKHRSVVLPVMKSIIIFWIFGQHVKHIVWWIIFPQWNWHKRSWVKWRSLTYMAQSPSQKLFFLSLNWKSSQMLAHSGALQVMDINRYYTILQAGLCFGLNPIIDLK